MQTVAIVGATGAVGQEILQLLQERNFPVRTLRCFASPKSKGQTVLFDREKIPLETLDDFRKIDLAFFCAGSAISREWKHRADCLVIDSSSAFRMDKDIPLIIPEINAHAAKGRWIASPNCAATILLMPLFRLHRRYRIKRIVASTYQAASGAGAKLLHELQEETRAYLSGLPYQHHLPFSYAFNLHPHQSQLTSSGYVEEEIKMCEETRKILEDEAIQMSTTCIRVPVLRAHSISANVEFHRPFTLADIYSNLSDVHGLQIFEDREQNRFATPADATKKDDVLCGRFRVDPSQPNTLEFWAVGDQLRKGAALNAVQIAEMMSRLRDC